MSDQNRSRTLTWMFACLALLAATPAHSQLTFTAPADLCIDAGVQAGLGTGVPTGGVYSGPGVTDDGNGMTYSFDPAAAGVGTHLLTYTNGGSASDDTEVFALPAVTFTALADLAVNAGVQLGLGGGSPTGGVYSGPGVTDDGNGMTYTFDPAAAGVGAHLLTYTFTNGDGCTGSAGDNVEVGVALTFTAPADLCIDAGVQAGLGTGVPTGGVYSGPGVTDDGNGMTYSFDPAAAGVGTHLLTYTNGGSASDDTEVFALPAVTFTALADLAVNAGIQPGLGGGSPTGGVYSGPGVTDDGNGMTYTFDPAAAGVGIHVLTYTFTNGNGCTGSASDNVEVLVAPTATQTPTQTPTATPTETPTSTATLTETPSGVDGASCSDGTQCQSGNCFDDVCCDRPCDGPGEACDVAGLEGTCRLEAATQAPAVSHPWLLVATVLSVGLGALVRRSVRLQ